MGRKELKAEIAGLKQGGSGGSGEIDRKSFEEAMAEHANSLQNRMEATQDHSDKKHKELQVSVERRHREYQARVAVLEEQIQEEQKERQSLGKECGVKLHAVTYGLF